MNNYLLNPINTTKNQNYIIDDYIEMRLEEWAKWFSRNDYRHLGYPSESLEFRHLNNGGVIHKNYGSKASFCNVDAEEVEKIIVLMKQVEPKAAAALCQEYLDWRCQSSKAKAIGVSLAQYKVNLALARQWLQGWFCAHFYKK